MERNELIKALRYCTDNEKQDGCDECPYLPNGMCHTMLSDAAYALEADDEMIADYTAAIDALDDSNDAYIKENERLKKRIAELEAQLPKQDRGVCMTAIGTLYVPNYDD